MAEIAIAVYIDEIYMRDTDTARPKLFLRLIYLSGVDLRSLGIGAKTPKDALCLRI